MYKFIFTLMAFFYLYDVSDSIAGFCFRGTVTRVSTITKQINFSVKDSDTNLTKTFSVENIIDGRGMTNPNPMIEVYYYFVTQSLIQRLPINVYTNIDIPCNFVTDAPFPVSNIEFNAAQPQP